MDIIDEICSQGRGSIHPQQRQVGDAPFFPGYIPSYAMSSKVALAAKDDLSYEQIQQAKFRSVAQGMNYDQFQEVSPIRQYFF